MNKHFRNEYLPYVKVKVKCLICGKEFDYYSAKGAELLLDVPNVMECRKCNKLILYDLGEPVHRHIMDFLEKKYKKIISWDDAELILLYERTVDNCECGEAYRITSRICPFCGAKNKDKLKFIGSEIIKIKQLYITHNKIKSLEDIKDPELREIFKDFDFRKWREELRQER